MKMSTIKTFEARATREAIPNMVAARLDANPFAGLIVEMDRGALIDCATDRGVIELASDLSV